MGQDGIASLPGWFRGACEGLRLNWALALIDLAGGCHDVLIDKSGHWCAWIWLSVLLIWNVAGALVIAVLMILAIPFYILSPDEVREEYWK